MAVSQYDKPSNYQLAPLPYEGMLNRRFQMWNKEQDAMLQMHEQLGALQGKISSYDVDPADKDSYEQFVSGYTPQIEEFAKGITGKSSLDPIMRGNWAKMISSAENHPTLQTFKYNKEQKDLARKNLEANRKNYTQFELEDAYEKIRKHKTIGPDGELKPYTAEGLYSKVDMTNKLLGWGKQVIAEYDEDFSALSDIEKAAKVTTLSKTKEGIMNKVMPVAWQDNEMRREALAYADIVADKQYDQPMTEEQRTLEAQKYIADKLAATAGLQEFTREEMSVVSSGVDAGSGGSKEQQYEVIGSVPLGQAGSEIKSTADLYNKMSSSRKTRDTMDMAKNSFLAQADGTENAKYYKVKGRYKTKGADGVEVDVHDQYLKLDADAEKAQDAYDQYVEYDNALSIRAQKEFEKDPEYLQEKKEFMDSLKGLSPDVKEEAAKYMEELYMRAAKDTEAMPSFFGKQVEMYAAGVESDKTGITSLQDHLNSKFKGQNISLDDVENITDEFFGFRKKATDIKEKHIEENTKGFVYENKLYRPEGKGASAVINNSIGDFKSFLTTNADIRLTNTNEKISDELRNQIVDSVINEKGEVIYNGVTTDFNGEGIQVFTVRNPEVSDPKDPNAFLRLEVTNPNVIPQLHAARKLSIAQHSLDSSLNRISTDPNKKGTLPFKGGDIYIEMDDADNNTFIAHIPMKNGKYATKRYTTREEFYKNYFGALDLIAEKEGITTGGITNISKKKRT